MIFLVFKASTSKNGFFIFFVKFNNRILKIGHFKNVQKKKSDPISFPEFLGVPLIISLNLYKSREPTVPSDAPSLSLLNERYDYQVLNITL
jgi:hypothetical protein